MPSSAAHPAPGTDAVAEIKTHVSQEVHSAVQKIQGSIKDEHKDIAAKLPTAQTLKSLFQQLGGAQKPAQAVAQYVLKGHPELAAVVSAITLALTETRDALAWVQTGPLGQLVKPILPAKLPALPQSWNDVSRFLSDCYAYLQGLAAAAPNEWVFRIRVAALLLLVYAVYRLFRKHPKFDAKKAEAELAKAQETIRELEAAAGK